MQAIKLCAVGALCQVIATVAQAQQPATLTLACKGTATSSSYPKDVSDPKSGEDPLVETVSMGIIFNFTTQSVQGFGFPGLGDYPVTITGINDVKILFSGQEKGTFYQSIIGSLDRVTGYLQATSSSHDEMMHKIPSVTGYELQCRPAHRMF